VAPRQRGGLAGDAMARRTTSRPLSASRSPYITSPDIWSAPVERLRAQRAQGGAPRTAARERPHASLLGSDGSMYKTCWGRSMETPSECIAAARRSVTLIRRPARTLRPPVASCARRRGTYWGRDDQADSCGQRPAMRRSVRTGRGGGVAFAADGTAASRCITPPHIARPLIHHVPSYITLSLYHVPWNGAAAPWSWRGECPGPRPRRVCARPRCGPWTLPSAMACHSTGVNESAATSTDAADEYMFIPLIINIKKRFMSCNTPLCLVHTAVASVRLQSAHVRRQHRS
jgi:hypothetical protein